VACSALALGRRGSTDVAHRVATGSFCPARTPRKETAGLSEPARIFSVTCMAAERARELRLDGDEISRTSASVRRDRSGFARCGHRAQLAAFGHSGLARAAAHPRPSASTSKHTLTGRRSTHGDGGLDAEGKTGPAPRRASADCVQIAKVTGFGVEVIAFRGLDPGAIAGRQLALQKARASCQIWHRRSIPPARGRMTTAVSSVADDATRQPAALPAPRRQRESRGPPRSGIGIEPHDRVTEGASVMASLRLSHKIQAPGRPWCVLCRSSLRTAFYDNREYTRHAYPATDSGGQGPAVGTPVRLCRFGRTTAVALIGGFANFSG